MNEEIAVLDEKNPLPFHVKCLRMSAGAIEKVVNDPRPQDPDFVPAMLERALYHIACSMEILRRYKTTDGRITVASQHETKQ